MTLSGQHRSLVSEARGCATSCAAGLARTTLRGRLADSGPVAQRASFGAGLLAVACVPDVMLHLWWSACFCLDMVVARRPSTGTADVGRTHADSESDGFAGIAVAAVLAKVAMVADGKAACVDVMAAVAAAALVAAAAAAVAPAASCTVLECVLVHPVLLA